MTPTYSLDQIRNALKGIDPVSIIEEGFVAYSQGKVVVPPVGEMILENPPGEVHIKYGYIKDGDYYVIKIASGFYSNPDLGLPSTQGMMLVFNQKTGEPSSILLDEGYLTEVRTAAAGAVVAKALAPSTVTKIGIIGAGMQGRMQLQYLKNVIECREAVVWGLNQEELDQYVQSMDGEGFNVTTTLNASEVGDQCDLIVTATPSKKPILSVNDIHPGTHITAMGSDTVEKIELDPAILGKADVVVADSIPQSQSRGEIFQSVKAGTLNPEKVLELGNVLQDPSKGRNSDEQITVADLTGVAVQDIQIAKAVVEAMDG